MHLASQMQPRCPPIFPKDTPAHTGQELPQPTPHPTPKSLKAHSIHLEQPRVLVAPVTIATSGLAAPVGTWSS